MYLYELALELDEKSVDLAARATELGLSGAGPSTQLNKHQAQALRQNVPMPELDENGELVGQALTFAEDGAAPEPEPVAREPRRPSFRPGGRKVSHDAPPIGIRRPRPDPDPAPRRSRRPRRQVQPQSIIVAVLLLAVFGLVVYMAMNVGSLDQKKQRLAAQAAKMDKLTSAASAAEAAQAAGSKLPEPGALGIVDQPDYCRGFSRSYSWVNELTRMIQQDGASPHSVNVPGWVRGKGERLDTALAQLQGSVGGTIAPDAQRFAAAAAKARTQFAAAETAAETRKAEEAWMAVLGDAKFVESVRQLQIGRVSACI